MRTPDQVSVMLPTFNRAPLLREALASVFAQTVSVREVLVVDDGSTDDTASVVREFDPTGSALRYIALDHTNSLGAVRNAGIRRATGSIIALLDSDDLWLPERVERQLALWNETPAARFAFCNVQRFDAMGPFSEGPWLDPAQDYSGRIVRELLLEPVALPSALMFDVQIYGEIGQYSGRPVNEDYEWLLEAAARYDACYSPQALVMLRAHDGSRSRARSLQAHTEYLKIVRRFLRSHPELPHDEVAAAKTGMANVHVKIARALLSAQDAPRAAMHARRAIRLNPADRRAYTLLFAALWGRVRPREARAT